MCVCARACIEVYGVWVYRIRCVCVCACPRKRKSSMWVIPSAVYSRTKLLVVRAAAPDLITGQQYCSLPLHNNAPRKQRTAPCTQKDNTTGEAERGNLDMTHLVDKDAQSLVITKHTTCCAKNTISCNDSDKVMCLLSNCSIYLTWKSKQKNPLSHKTQSSSITMNEFQFQKRRQTCALSCTGVLWAVGGVGSHSGIIYRYLGLSRCWLGGQLLEWLCVGDLRK